MTTLMTGHVPGGRGPLPLDDDVDLGRDRALVERAQAGDRTAFDDLYQRYYRRLYRFCLRRLQDPHEAEDVAQEAFARAWRALPSFAGDRRFYPWLSVIAAHRCTDVLRRRHRSTPVAEFHQGNVASTEEGGEERVIAAVDSDLVAQAFQRLSDRHQRILALREGSGWSYQMIADHEGIGITAIETLLWRARQALKREFASLAGADGRLSGLVGGLLGLPLLRRLLTGVASAARRVASLATSAGPWTTAAAVTTTAAVSAAVVVGAVHIAPAPGRPVTPTAAGHRAPTGPGPRAATPAGSTGSADHAATTMGRLGWGVPPAGRSPTPAGATVASGPGGPAGMTAVSPTAVDGVDNVVNGVSTALGGTTTGTGTTGLAGTLPSTVGGVTTTVSGGLTSALSSLVPALSSLGHGDAAATVAGLGGTVAGLDTTVGSVGRTVGGTLSTATDPLTELLSALGDGTAGGTASGPGAATGGPSGTGSDLPGLATDLTGTAAGLTGQPTDLTGAASEPTGQPTNLSDAVTGLTGQPTDLSGEATGLLLELAGLVPPATHAATTGPGSGGRSSGAGSAVPGPTGADPTGAGAAGRSSAGPRSPGAPAR